MLDMKSDLHELKQQRRETRKRLEQNEREMEYASRAIAAIDHIRELDNCEMVLERPDVTFAHQFREAVRNDAVVNINRSERTDDSLDYEQEIFSQAQYFLVQHDWAAVFRGATDYADGDFRLPFEICVFEFKISGNKFLIACIDVEDDIKLTPIVETPWGWCITGISFNLKAEAAKASISSAWKIPGQEESGHLLRFIIEQLRAVCIALDAEVADTEKIETPPKLNKARAKAGKAPIADHHLINLARRFHGHAEGAGGSGTGKRLHFRRGHWRHYPDRRVWIRWTLVGNPDLGFVEKAYRL